MTNSLSNGGTDIVALYGALVGVAAITTALQTAAVSVGYSDVAAIESRYDGATTASQAYNDAREDARVARTRLFLINAPAAAVNGLVVAALTDVVLVRGDFDWVLALPWIALAVTLVLLVVAVVKFASRLNAVSNGTRGTDATS
ncbi:MAG TPA: hypothetical protein VFU30_11825 [Gaiellaceae bacterium]|nr:hypothetical protein [Gaiellaceae bacterium]